MFGRTELAKDKTGVEILGVRAINPVNKKEIPVFHNDCNLQQQKIRIIIFYSSQTINFHFIYWK